MEKMDSDLDTLIKQGGVTLNQRKSILSNVIIGLHEIHRKNIVHRDLVSFCDFLKSNNLSLFG